MAVHKKNILDFSPSIYDGVRSRMTLFQRVCYWILSLFYRQYALTFCKNVGLKQVINSLNAYAPGWILNFGVSLGPSFAGSLYDLLLGCYLLKPLFFQTILSDKLYEVKIQEEPLVIEGVFHALYKQESIANYPLASDFASNQNDTLATSYNNYVQAITNVDYYNVDTAFTHWFHLTDLLHQDYVDFLKRFNPDFSFEEDVSSTEMEWSSVSVQALKGYLEKLIDVVYKIDVSVLDLKTLTALNQSQVEEDYLIPDDILQSNYRKVIKSLKLFQKNNNLLQVLRLAYVNPVLTFQKEEEILSISEKYLSLMENRINQQLQSASDTAFEEEMQSILSEEGVDQIGIYTQKNSMLCQRTQTGSFSYVYLVPLIKQFLLGYLKPWFKNFVSALVVNVKFVQENDLKSLEQLYRKLGKFEAKANTMLNNLGAHSTVGTRFTKLIDMDFEKNDRRMLQVFVESINKDVEEIVEEFVPIYTVLSYSVSSLIGDLANNTNHYVLNTGSVRTILGESDQQLYKLNHLFDSINRVFSKIDKTV